MKLVVGLGNPGREYENTRHNMGFLALDEFAEMCGVDFEKEGFKGTLAMVKRSEFPEPVLLLKPLTYMNLSGESVVQAKNFYKLDPSDILVVYDDMAIPEGSIRLRPGGSSGGHKGMKSIIQLLGTDAFPRIRIGIGEPLHSGVDHVLGKLTGESAIKAKEATHMAAIAIRDALMHGFPYAMNHHNKK